MTVLLPEQAQALGKLQGICQEIGAEIVVVGAIAARIWLLEEHRPTEDVDAVALDLDELPQLTERLTARGWQQDHHREHRWHSPEKARFDLLPIGPKAIRQKQIIWPRAETRMRLVG